MATTDFFIYWLHQAEGSLAVIICELSKMLLIIYPQMLMQAVL